MKKNVMRGRGGIASVCVLTAAASAACAAAPQHTPSPKPTPTPARPSSTPSPPAGPFAVVVTNAPRTGSTYQVLLIDLSGRVVTSVTAQLPHVKPNQTLDLPLVSASATAVYYLDGDTTIKSLAPTGATAVVKTIPAGASDEITFDVSPDNTRIAVADIVEQSDSTKDTGKGYVEDLAATGNHVQLWDNTSIDAARWPVGWSGHAVVDAVGTTYAQGCYGGPPCATTPSSYHVVDATSGNRVATVCEAPARQPPGSNDNYSVQGSPVAAGTACVESNYGAQQQTATLEAVDWSGNERDFISVKTTNYGPLLDVGGCFLAPDGSRMACLSNSSQAVTVVSSNGKEDNLGRRFGLLGWIDASHLLVEIDATHLGVLDPDSGAVTTVALDGADKIEMTGVLPAGL